MSIRLNLDKRYSQPPVAMRMSAKSIARANGRLYSILKWFLKRLGLKNRWGQKTVCQLGMYANVPVILIGFLASAASTAFHWFIPIR
jgi:hypothetical protein